MEIEHYDSCLVGATCTWFCDDKDIAALCDHFPKTKKELIKLVQSIIYKSIPLYVSESDKYNYKSCCDTFWENRVYYSKALIEDFQCVIRFVENYPNHIRYSGPYIDSYLYRTAQKINALKLMKNDSDTAFNAMKSDQK